MTITPATTPPPTSAELTVRALAANEFPRELPEAVFSASAKTAGAVVPDLSAEQANGLAVSVGKGSVRECFTAGRKLGLFLTEVEDLKSVHLDLRKLSTSTDASSTVTSPEGLDDEGAASIATTALRQTRNTTGGDPNAAIAITAFVRGLWVSTYELARWKKVQPPAKLEQVEVGVKAVLPQSQLEQVLAKAHALATGQMAAMHLVDRPANAKKPADVAAYVVELGGEHGFEVEVLDEEALEIQGFGGILAVGRASDYPPRLLKLHYKGGDKYHLGFVGKGVTFDTGGISIKPSTNLGAMKSDLGGAAAILGTFISTAMMGLPVELHGLLGVAENAIDGDAYLPSDVIRNYSGKTIEITDTDAEGRLVMADALAYMPEWATPELTIDVATLTGSAVRTFGYEAGALFTHDPKVVADLAQAGEAHGERTWPLPLWEAYAADLHSDVADVKHFHGKPITGAINAAKFLEFFVADPQRWAHLDIAGVAFGNSEYTKDRAATGYGVALLTQLIIDHSHE